MARSTRPPPKVSGQQKRYVFGTSEESSEASTKILCPTCSKSPCPFCGDSKLVSPKVAMAIKNLLKAIAAEAKIEPPPARTNRR